jgi:EF hand
MHHQTTSVFATFSAAVLTAIMLAGPVFAGDELPAGEHKGGKLHEKILVKFDANHDGKLDDGEKTAARAALYARLNEKHPELLAKLDADHDGMLSEAEMKAGREQLKAVCAARTQKKDAAR